MKIGWLSPEGDLFEVNHYEHYWGAICLLEKLGLKDFGTRPDDALMDLGYVHITVSLFWDKTIRLDWKRHLTANQIYFLRDYFNAKDFDVEPSDRIRFDKEVDEFWEYD